MRYLTDLDPEFAQMVQDKVIDSTNRLTKLEDNAPKAFDLTLRALLTLMKPGSIINTKITHEKEAKEYPIGIILMHDDGIVEIIHYIFNVNIKYFCCNITLLRSDDISRAGNCSAEILDATSISVSDMLMAYYAAHGFTIDETTAQNTHEINLDKPKEE